MHETTSAPDAQSEAGTEQAEYTAATPEAVAHSSSSSATPVGAHRRRGRSRAVLDWLRDPSSGYLSPLQRVTPRMRLVQVGSAVAAAGVLAATAGALASVPQDTSVASATFVQPLVERDNQAPAGAQDRQEQANRDNAGAAGPGNAPGAQAKQSPVEEIKSWSTKSADTIPVSQNALQAYAEAEQSLEEKRPNCNLPWNLLAGIGRIESKHGEIFGAKLNDEGSPTDPIVGIALDGSSGVKAITDTDGGKLDGDPVTDRAVGPMQFIPTTWEKWGMDGNHDGKVDPQNLNDAAASAGNYLCGEGEARDLSGEDAQREALMEYNQSAEYGQDVLDAAAEYAQAGGPRSERG
ncbi:murein transglycosylase [Allosaccharopolyspora coralli]|uniref:Murein transglycosylase n=1 Tax=Allosaccharopolyspora coralli TaxID=2665642 RepID=A0A5Q3QBR9_9PSEU|nr:lytic transglycosylase domain-containing protein [Allosaccharopolyspora coralli]QGK70816.1 murein transglycosylase [Allosaccharopolyspora coralli]